MSYFWEKLWEIHENRSYVGPVSVKVKFTQQRLVWTPNIRFNWSPYWWSLSCWNFECHLLLRWLNNDSDNFIWIMIVLTGADTISVRSVHWDITRNRLAVTSAISRHMECSIPPKSLSPRWRWRKSVLLNLMTVLIERPSLMTLNQIKYSYKNCVCFIQTSQLEQWFLTCRPWTIICSKSL